MRRILCAEDDEQLGDLIKWSLGSIGHSVETVPDGQAAFERIAADPARFHVLLTDHQMPRLNGLGLVRKLREIPFAGRILVQSGSLSSEEVRHYQALGVDAVLQKPVQISALVSAVCAVLATFE
ncbi:MAG TPA: response regulator [Opitutus sp.]|nr:response regulator [Opitutus sp.]